MSRTSLFLASIFSGMVVLAGLFIWSGASVKHRQDEVRELGRLTAALRLTDLSLSNDARYTRHPSQADIFSAFQDQPGSIDHFPSGSVTAPPDFSSVGTTINPGKP